MDRDDFLDCDVYGPTDCCLLLRVQRCGFAYCEAAYRDAARLGYGVWFL